MTSHTYAKEEDQWELHVKHLLESLLLTNFHMIPGESCHAYHAMTELPHHIWIC